MAGEAGPDPRHQQESAVARVRRLLAGRLRRRGVVTSRPEWYFQCEASDPEPYAAGETQVRVRTWRHWSDAALHIDADGGDTLYCRVDRHAYPKSNVELSPEEAVTAVREQTSIPRDAHLADFRQEAIAAEHKLTYVEWVHVHRGLRVESDGLKVHLHPQTRRIVELRRRWRRVRLPGHAS